MSHFLIRRHPQCEPAAFPAARFFGSERAPRHVRPSFPSATHSTSRPERTEGRRSKSKVVPDYRNVIKASFCLLTSFFGLSVLPSVSLVATRGCGVSSSGSLAGEVGVSGAAATLPGEGGPAPEPESCETSLGLLLRVSLCLEGGALYPPLRETSRGGASCPAIHSSARRAGSDPAVSG